MKRIAIRKNPRTRPRAAAGARGRARARGAGGARPVPRSSRRHTSVEPIRSKDYDSRREPARTSGRTPATLAGVARTTRPLPPGRSRSKPLRSSLDEFTIFRIPLPARVGRSGSGLASAVSSPPLLSWSRLPSRGRRSRCRGPRSKTPLADSGLRRYSAAARAPEGCRRAEDPDAGVPATTALGTVTSELY